MSSKETKQTHPYLQYGGQAVIEGVMMRSPHYFAVACRKPDGGIIVQEEPVDRSIVGKFQWMNRPLLRGTLALIDAMALGMKALNFAASVQTKGLAEQSANSGASPSDAETSEETPRLQEPADPETPSAPQRVSSRISDIAVGATLVTAIVFGIALFVALPTGLTQWIQGLLGIPHGVPLPHRQQVLLNLVDGVIRITIFLGYIALISRMENIRRVFQYHGAEHKAINTLEAGETLTPENCLRSSRIHPRCGTSFIIVVLLASIVVHSLLPRPAFFLTRLALHIGLIPIVAGLAYEVIKLAGRFRDSILTRTLLAPGLWSQQLTTREPAIEHIEVALAALKAVVAAEEARDRASERSESPAEAAAAASSAVA